MRNLLCLAALSVAASRGQAQTVPRVSNPGRDVVMSVVVRERARIGTGADGVTFFRVYPWNVTTDGRGNVYVLDSGDYRVLVFDSNGVHLRDMGREGGGPGEFRRPVGIAVTEDGTISVADEIKHALVRFSSSGSPLQQQPLFFRPGILHATTRGILMGSGGNPGRAIGLHRVWPDTATLRAMAAGELVSFPGCPISISGQRPFFAPSVVVGTWGAVAVVNDTADYALNVLIDGEWIATVTRNIPPIAIDRTTALQAPPVRRGYFVSSNGRQICKVSPQELLDSRGFLTSRSPVERIAVTPLGGFWVQRRLDLLGPAVIDVFDATYSYKGTLPPSTPLPSVFLSPSRFATVQHDDDGVPYVVIYDIG